jgi:hypothetical protein
MWDVENKKVFFAELVTSIKEGEGKSLTSIIALKQLLEEVIERIN